MKRYLSLIIPTILLVLTTTIYSQDIIIKNAIERLEKRGLLTRIIERYKQDSRQYAFLKDLIVAVDELVSAGDGVRSGLADRIRKVEEEIAKLRRGSSAFGKIDEIESLVRKYIEESSRISEGKLKLISDRLEADSIKIADLDNRIKDLKKKEGIVSPATSNRTFLLIVIVVSAIALLSAR